MNPRGAPWFAELERDLRTFISPRIRSPADADDVLQEALLRIVRGLPALREEDALHGWVYRIARSVVADHHRGASRTLLLDDTAAEEPAATDADETAPPGQILAVWLRLAVEELPEPYRSTLRATEIHERPHADVAAEMGVSVSAIKSRVARGREKLRDALMRCCDVEIDARGAIMGFRGRACGCEG